MEKFSISNINNESNEKKTSVIEQLKRKFGNNLYIALAIIASFVSSPKESSAISYSNSNHLIEQKDSTNENKAKLELQKQKDFLVSWFSNRIIDNNKAEKNFKKDLPSILNRLRDVTLVKSSNLLGSAEWTNDTVFYQDEVLNKPGLNSAFTHELSHDAFPANYGNNSSKEKFHTEMPEWMTSIIVDAIKKSGDEGLSDVYIFKKYYQRPEEIYARVCALRYKNDFKPNQIINKEDLEKIIEQNKEGQSPDDNVKSLLMTITNNESLLKLLNNLP
jgi:hypothetical protein